jgi:hypothetical protein
MESSVIPEQDPAAASRTPKIKDPLSALGYFPFADDALGNSLPQLGNILLGVGVPVAVSGMRGRVGSFGHFVSALEQDMHPLNGFIHLQRGYRAMDDAFGDINDGSLIDDMAFLFGAHHYFYLGAKFKVVVRISPEDEKEFIHFVRMRLMDHDAGLAQAKQLHLDREAAELRAGTSGFPANVQHGPDFDGFRHEIFSIFRF